MGDNRSGIFGGLFGSSTSSSSQPPVVNVNEEKWVPIVEERKTLNIRNIPGLKPITQAPSRPALVPRRDIEFLINQYERSYSDIDFSEEKMKERKRFIRDYNQQVQNETERHNNQLRLWLLKLEEYKAMEEIDTNMASLRAELKVTLKLTNNTPKVRVTSKTTSNELGKAWSKSEKLGKTRLKKSIPMDEDVQDETSRSSVGGGSSSSGDNFNPMEEVDQS